MSRIHTTHLPVLLFGYDSSAFTNKVRLALRIKQIPFAYVTVPSMMPRKVLTETIGLTYRKIPVLAIGRDIYCDTSLIIEALEHFIPPPKYGTVYPPIKAGDRDRGWDYRGLVRGFASFWVDRPFFRITTGLIPPSVWRSQFGTDRAQLIGHQLDPEKLGRKVPGNLAALNTHLSVLEPTVRGGIWLLPTEGPSLADIALYYQLKWGIDIASGKGVYNLTAGGVGEGGEKGAGSVFNEQRFPGLWTWFQRFEEHIAGLPDHQAALEPGDMGWKDALKALEHGKGNEEGLGLVPTAVSPNAELDGKRGLVPGVTVSVVPDDTGRDNPTMGRLISIGTEEVIIKPLERGEVDVNIHFPRLGFVVKTVDSNSSKQ